MTEQQTTPSADDAEQSPALTDPEAAPAAADGTDEQPVAEPTQDDAAAADATQDEATPAEATPDDAAPADATQDEAAPTDATPDEAVTADDAAADDAPAADEATASTDETAVSTDEPAVAAEQPAQAETATDDAEQPAAADEPGDATPRPAPRPSPASLRGLPRPSARPVAAAAGAPAAAPAAPAGPPVDPAEAARAAEFGRVDEDGTVHVREAAGERVVGQFPGASAEEALGLYVRRYLDLQAKVVLFETRLAATDLSVKEIDQTLTKLGQELAEPAAVGDLDGLRARLDGLRERAAERRAQAEAERQAAREAAVASRTQIVEQAEKIAGTDPSRIQWRPAGEQLRALLEQWKEAQRQGPRIDRPTEESLWKRFSHARTTFDRERRHFFAELESRNAEAKAAKEALVAQAEALSGSTDWGATSAAFRDLMARWKSAGRANRQVDDALWARFRAAQDAFFAARDAANQAVDAEFRANLEVKEALLVEAEAILPVRDLGAAKAALRSLQDRWEAAGKVPRGDLQRVEGRMRAVEQAVRDAESAQWRRSNPETRARAEGAAAQLEQAIAGLEDDLAKAQAAGDQRRVAEAQAALDARRAWLEQVQRAADDARG
ncbi:DUF349 domain-containing protein [Cellulomonas sp. NPDC057328]|uniref:DUF349 domain-containing protein n=1 Tax=Cellulomonas sp. NPDC057328 TaxID=3346101 RepID=UPI003639E2DE